MIHNWAATAFNQVPNAENEIHGDKVAKQYGFKGGLVPGATMSAYLIHPFVEAFGMQYLENGCAHVRLNSPLYDSAPFQVEVTAQDSSSGSTRLIQSDASPCATADIKIENGSILPPVVRGDELGDKQATGEMAILDLFEKKGHEFVDAEFNLFDADRGTCFSAVHLRAIYRLRGM